MTHIELALICGGVIALIALIAVLWRVTDTRATRSEDATYPAWPTTYSTSQEDTDA